MTDLSRARCEHCGKSFGYQLYHCGFGECSYAYCSQCGMTAVLSHWYEHMPKIPSGSLPQQEISEEFEQFLKPCSCGGIFKKGSHPRCPHCHQPLSAQVASRYIEANAAGAKKGWWWQRNWHETYCIVIDKREVRDNYKFRSSSP